MTTSASTTWAAAVADLRSLGQFFMGWYDDGGRVVTVSLPPFDKARDPLGRLRAEHMERARTQRVGDWVSASGIVGVSVPHAELAAIEGVGNLVSLVRHFALVRCAYAVIDIGERGFEWRATWRWPADAWELSRDPAFHDALTAVPKFPEDLAIDPPYGASDDDLLALYQPRAALMDLSEIAKGRALRSTKVGVVTRVQQATALLEEHLFRCSRGLA